VTPIYAGTFDPLTKGHMNVIDMMVRHFGKGVVLLATNPNKQHMLTGEERHNLIRDALHRDYNAILKYKVGVSATYGYVADWARDLYGDEAVLVRGVRNEKDYLYEKEIADFNRKRAHVETILIPANDNYQHVSSTQIKEWMRVGNWEEIKRYTPESVMQYLMQKMIQEKK